jgi:hypothetical protein
MAQSFLGNGRMPDKDAEIVKLLGKLKIVGIPKNLKKLWFLLLY